MSASEHIQLALAKARGEATPLLSPTAERVSPPLVRSAEQSPPPARTWSGLRTAVVDPRLARKNRLVTMHRSDPAHVSFDILRTRIHQMMQRGGWKTVAITSPGPDCGKSSVSLNLAFSLAHQSDFRVALVDLDLRRPSIAHKLGMPNPPVLSEFLSGRAEVEDVFVRYGDNIAIAANARPADLPAELLQSAQAASAFASIKRKLQPDLIIFDLPPYLETDDVQGFLPNADCTVLIVAADLSTKAQIDECERQLASSTNLLGVVLNACRYATSSGYPT